MDECFFKFGLTDKKLSTCGPTRIQTIISSSIQRCIGIHVELQRRLDEDNLLQIDCNLDCVDVYIFRENKAIH